MLKRKIKNVAKSGLRRVFEIGQRLGVDVLPRHFYSQIPVIRDLRRTTHWREPFPMLGVAGTDTGEQLEFVRECAGSVPVERLRECAVFRDACEMAGEQGYCPIAGDFLHCFVASKRPARILQIGCGVSTAICLLAARDAEYQPEVICVEPYPSAFLRAASRRNEIRLIEEKVETTSVDVGEELGDGDLLFVDSTHTLGPAGEVTRIILEMLPKLKNGVFVHFHDIYFPYDYQRGLLADELFFCHETPLLLAFLTGNQRFRIMVSMAMLHYDRPAELSRLLPNYRPARNDLGLETEPGHFPSSIYLKVVGEGSRD